MAVSTAGSELTGTVAPVLHAALLSAADEPPGDGNGPGKGKGTGQSKGKGKNGGKGKGGGKGGGKTQR